MTHSNSSVQSSSIALLKEDVDSCLFIQNVPPSIRLFLSPVEENSGPVWKKCFDLLPRYLPACLFYRNNSGYLSFCLLFLHSLRVLLTM